MTQIAQMLFGVTAVHFQRALRRHRRGFSRYKFLC